MLWIAVFQRIKIRKCESISTPRRLPSFLYLYLFFIFYLSRYNLPDFPSVSSLTSLPFLSCCHRTTAETPHALMCKFIRIAMACQMWIIITLFSDWISNERNSVRCYFYRWCNYNPNVAWIQQDSEKISLCVQTSLSVRINQ